MVLGTPSASPATARDLEMSPGGNPSGVLPVSPSSFKVDARDQTLAGVIAGLSSDSELHVFLDPGFSPERHVATAFTNQQVPAALESAERAVTFISSHVRDEVIRRQDALLGEVETVSELEQQISSVSDGVSALVGATGSVQDAVSAPYLPMTRAVTRAKNMHQCALILRKVHRFRFCARRLRLAGFLSGGGAPAPSNAQGIDDGEGAGSEENQLMAAAEHVVELEALLASSSSLLERVDVVKTEVPAVRRALESARPRAVKVLRDALVLKDKASASSALHALNTLGVLEDRVSGEIARLISAAQTTIVEGFDPNKSVRMQPKSATEKPTMTRDGWLRIESMIRSLSSYCTQVVVLQSVLENSIDSTSHRPLVEEFNGGGRSIALAFFQNVSALLRDAMETMARARRRSALGELLHVFMLDFARFKLLFVKLARDLDDVVSTIAVPQYAFANPVVGYGELESFLVDATSPVQSAFISSSMERMAELITSYFSSLGKQARQGAAASAATANSTFGARNLADTDIVKLVTQIGSDYLSSQDDVRMVLKTAVNVSVALKTFGLKSDELLKQLASAPASVADQIIVSLVNALASLSSVAGGIYGSLANDNGDAGGDENDASSHHPEYSAKVGSSTDLEACFGFVSANVKLQREALSFRSSLKQVFQNARELDARCSKTCSRLMQPWNDRIQKSLTSFYLCATQYFAQRDSSSPSSASASLLSQATDSLIADLVSCRVQCLELLVPSFGVTASKRALAERLLRQIGFIACMIEYPNTADDGTEPGSVLSDELGRVTDSVEANVCSRRDVSQSFAQVESIRWLVKADGTQLERELMDSAQLSRTTSSSSRALRELPRSMLILHMVSRCSAASTSTWQLQRAHELASVPVESMPDWIDTKSDADIEIAIVERLRSSMQSAPPKPTVDGDPAREHPRAERILRFFIENS